MTLGYWLLLGAFLVSWAVTNFVRARALRWGLIDKPTSRSSHASSTPRGGGVGMVIAFELVLCALLLNGEITLWSSVLFGCGGLVIAVIGFLDDFNSIRASIRFGIHLSVGVLAALIMRRMCGQSVLPGGAWISFGAYICIFVWGINCFNFMDGIDGIAATQALFMATAAAVLNAAASGPPWITISLACLAAAAAGFLTLNWPPAKIFMGDCASGFLGFTFAAFALVPIHAPGMSFKVWVILGSLFLLDASVTLVRRILRRERFFSAHRLHAYQHLARRWGHRSITTAFSLINVVWLFPWACLAVLYPNYSTAALAIALVPVTIGFILAGAGKQENSA